MHASDFGRTLIIANPAAQSGAAREVAERLQRFLDMTARASQFDLVLTKRMGHAKELAAQAQAEGVPVTDKIALVLTDLEMPEMDGFTLTRKIKTDPVLKDIPVVIHSSLSGNANEDHIRKVKADGYVAKFELNELSSVIEEVLDRSMKKIEGPLISRKQLA